MTRRAITCAAGAAVGIAAGASANPVDGRYFDTPECDNHGSLIAIDELGTGPLFEPMERIDAISTFTDFSPCPVLDEPNIPNSLVIMTNLTGRFLTDLYYVGDVETSFANVDGLATSDELPPPGSFVTFAFRIDAIGINRPLIAESMTADGVFEPGEVWEFVIQDYVNTLGLPASFMGSLDFAGGSLGDTLSSGSIVQFVVPAPGAVSLAGLSLLLAARRRR